LSAASSDGFGFCSVILYVPFFSLRRFPYFKTFNSGWDIQDVVYSRELLISTKANGYRDITAVIDLSTFRRIPWEQNSPFFLVSFLDPDTNKPICADPRGLLKLMVDQGTRLGYSAMAGVEYEVRLLTLTVTALMTL